MSRFFFKILISLTLVVGVFASAARANENGAFATATQTALQSVLSSQKYPLSIQLKNLDASWRRFLLSEGNENATQMRAWGAGSGFKYGVHFTEGDIVQIGEESFLVAYRLPVKIAVRTLNQIALGPVPIPRKPDGDTILCLSLLNLKSIGSLDDLRPFNPRTDMDSDRPAREESVRTLEQLGQGVLRYIRARGKLPVLHNPLDWGARRTFYPYVGDERLFMQPGTQQPYRFNEILGGKKAAHISNKQSFVVFYESQPAGDGTTGVLFMDGQVERLSPAHWEIAKRASKIEDAVPAPPT
jgi:hypothetical protein